METLTVLKETMSVTLRKKMVKEKETLTASAKY